MSMSLFYFIHVHADILYVYLYGFNYVYLFSLVALFQYTHFTIPPVYLLSVKTRVVEYSVSAYAHSLLLFML